MRVEVGNIAPHEVRDDAGPVLLAHREPCVSFFRLDDELTLEPGGDAREMLAHMALNPTVTHLPDHEMFVVVFHPTQGCWASHSSSTPEWVLCKSQVDEAKASELERLCSDAWGCARGRPDDVEDRYHTPSGPPGVGPDDAGPAGSTWGNP